jgi:hypothetical protein
VAAGVRMDVRADVRKAHGGAAQDLSQQRGGVKDPRSGPGPILEAAPQSGTAWGSLGRGTQEQVGDWGC